MNATVERPMSRLFTYLKNYKGDVAFASINAVLNKLFDLMPPFLTAWLIDSVSGNIPYWINSGMGMDTARDAVIFLGILTAAIFLFESFFEWLFQRGFLRLAQNVQHDLRVATYDKLQHREIAFFETERTGNLMSILNDDINQLERFLNTGFYEILHLITLFIFATVSLFWVSPELAWIGLIPIPLILIGSIFYQRLISPYYQNIRQTVGALSSRLENNISGIMVIKSFTAEKFEKERVEEMSDKYRIANFKAIRYNSLYVPLIRILITIGFVSVLMLGSFMILNGTGGLTLGVLAFFSMMIQRLLWPVTRIGRIFDEFERAKAAARRVFGIMDGKPMINDGREKIEKVEGRISFEQVGFKYSNGQSVLNRIDLNIEPGMSVGIAGTTGAGKTTLVKLLLRLYDIDTGRILLDGVDIRNISLYQLRKKMALVSQDVYMFHGTIKENIAYGMESKTLEEVREAAKMAELDEFVMSLKEGYDSIIGERGIKLSGGQRQRLSIARALLKNAPILILDEATSAVDTETERSIQRNLEKLIRGRTALIIAHRLSTIRNADQIVVLDQGGIGEKGTHVSLLEKNGIYADLWKIQLGEIV